jgi:DNA-binding NarL/FixJ family response regulator
MTRPRVLVADPFAIFRAGVRDLLARASEFSVVEASDLDDTRRVLAELGAVDIALVDADLPRRGGVAAVEWLQAHSCVDTIVWSFEPTREGVLATVRAGAKGFLHKDISPDGLVRSLRGLSRGEAPFSRDLTTLMIDAIHHFRGCEVTRDRLSTLTPREAEVLERIARGARNRQIAAELTISEFTVKRHVQNILEKLGLSSRQDAADFHRVAQLQRAGAGEAS